MYSKVVIDAMLFRVKWMFCLGRGISQTFLLSKRLWFHLFTFVSKYRKAKIMQLYTYSPKAKVYVLKSLYRSNVTNLPLSCRVYINHIQLST